MNKFLDIAYSFPLCNKYFWTECDMSQMKNLTKVLNYLKEYFLLRNCESVLLIIDENVIVELI